MRSGCISEERNSAGSALRSVIASANDDVPAPLSPPNTIRSPRRIPPPIARSIDGNPLGISPLSASPSRARSARATTRANGEISSRVTCSQRDDARVVRVPERTRRRGEFPLLPRGCATHRPPAVRSPWSHRYNAQTGRGYWRAVPAMPATLSPPTRARHDLLRSRPWRRAMPARVGPTSVQQVPPRARRRVAVVRRERQGPGTEMRVARGHTATVQ